MKTLTDIPEKNNSSNSYWLITIFHAIGGILSAIFIVLLITTSFPGIFNNHFVMMLFGVIFLIFSYFTMTKKNTKFAEYFIFAFALIGGGLFVIGLIMMISAKGYSIGLIIIFTYSILFWLIPSLLHRFISVFLILSGSYYFCIYFNIEILYSSLLFILSTWFWLYKYKDSTYISNKQIIGYTLLFFILITTNNHEIVLQQNQFIYKSSFSSFVHDYLLIFIYYVTGLLTISMICLKYEFKLNIIISIVLGTFLFYFTQPTGISLAEPIVVLLLAFLRKNKILMVLGTLSMLNIIYTYYAITYIDFLSKAKLLSVFGLVILILAFILHIYLKKQKGEIYA